MNAAFIHELKMYETPDGKLFLRGYNEDYWKRYLRYFDLLYVFGRKINVSYDQVVGLDEFKGNGLIFEEVPSIYSIKSNIPNTIKVRRKIKTILNKVDFVIARQPGEYASIALHYCRRFHKRYLIEMVGCPWDSYWNHSMAGKIAAPFVFLKTRYALKKSQNTIYVTEKFLQKRYPTKGESIGCSDVIIERPDDEVLRQRLSKIRNGSNKLIIGTAAGVGVKYKGQQYVIRALAELKQEGCDDFEYQMAGNGNREYLQSLIEKNNISDCVKFMGSITHEKISEWYKSLDIYIQPSLQEGMPRAVIEAMSCAVPCAGSIVGGIPELLDEEVLFKKRSVRQIKNILNKMREDKYRQRQAEYCFSKSKDYDTEVLERKRIDYLNMVLKEKIK